MSFLILLNNDDYVKLPRYCFMSNKDRIIKNRGHFPGKLHIRNYADIEHPDFRNQFIIEGYPLPKQLYVRLPKENIYVPYESYSTKLLNSKLGELRDLFIHLKAKTIKIKKTEISDNKVGANGKIGVSNVGVGAGFENSELFKNEFVEELHFDADNKPIDVNAFREAYGNSYMHEMKYAKNHVKPKFYYLAQEYSWEDIIERRLNNRLVQDKYVYNHTDSRILKMNILNQLKLFDINIDAEKSEVRQLIIEYDIEYHPLFDVEEEERKKEEERKEEERKREMEERKREEERMIGKFRSPVTIKFKRGGLEKKKSLKDIVLDVIHMHPHTEPEPEPHIDSIDVSHHSVDTEERKKEEEECAVSTAFIDDGVEPNTVQKLESDINKKNVGEEESASGNTHLFDDDDNDTEIPPKPSFPDRTVYGVPSEDLDKLILPDIPIVVPIVDMRPPSPAPGLVVPVAKKRGRPKKIHKK